MVEVGGVGSDAVGRLKQVETGRRQQAAARVSKPEAGSLVAAAKARITTVVTSCYCYFIVVAKID